MSKRLFSFLLIILFIIVVSSFDSIQIPQIQKHNEMLVPLNSTTALLCELVFNQGQPNEEARWIYEGKEIARVNGNRNALLNTHFNKITNSSTKGDKIPEIGFLIIQQTLLENEGDYWCERLSDGQLGERTRLRVAFLKKFVPNVVPFIEGEDLIKEEGQLLVINCPNTLGVPPPIINWKLNGERLTDFLSLNMEIAPNGSLILHNFSALQSGFYSCEATNFVDKTLSESLFVGPPKSRTLNTQIANNFVDCLNVYVRSGVLWFLLGCLATSCMILAYIVGALFLYQLYSSNEQRNRLRRWPPCCPFLTTSGFRKVVAPMDSDRIAPPSYEESV